MSFMDELRRRMLKRMREIEREFEALEEEISRAFREFEETMLPYEAREGRLEPLTSMQEYPDKYVILLDLPLADLDAISVEAKGRKLYVRAQLRQKLRLDSWMSSLRGSSIHEYYKIVELPSDAKISEISVEKRKGCLVIIVPRE